MIYRILSFLKNSVTLVFAFLVAMFIYDLLKELWRIYITKK